MDQTEIEPEEQNSPDASPKRPMSVVAKVLLALLFVVLIVVALGFGEFAGLLRTHTKNTAGGAVSFGDAISELYNVGVDPAKEFGDKQKIVICCMGIDDNWTNSDEVFTTGSRTDTLFLMSLDLANKKATMLSIPRDAYVPIAGTDYSSKINSAYATGGPARTEATIEQWLGVQPDYYLVLNIDATRRLVDALGGVDVNVEHQMDYDDNWGQLHVHLKPGFQHLDGAEAVAFARFRHPNHGTTPEDGDERRMYRQHVLLKAMIAQAKEPSNLIQFQNLVNTGIECIHTDMNRAQLLSLAKLFSGINQDTDIQTVSLPGEDGKSKFGAYVMLIDPTTAKLYVQWMINGDPVAARELTPIEIANATTTSGLAANARSVLKQAGYNDAVLAGDIQSVNPGQTIIVDEGVPDHSAAQDIATSLHIANPVILRQPVHPNKMGWTPPAVVKVELGSDYSPTAQQASATAGQAGNS